MCPYSGGRPEAVPKASAAITVALLVALGAVSLLACVILGGRQFVLLQYYDELQAMEQELVVLEQEVRQLRRKQETIQTDPFHAERVAREGMNYSAPGEVIFRFE